MIECGVLNRLRGTGTVHNFGSVKGVDIKLVGNHLYGIWLALVLGLVGENIWLGVCVLIAYIVGEAKGWGEWVGALTRWETKDEEWLQKQYKDNEGVGFPYIHQIANMICKEQIEGSLEERVTQYKKYAELALVLRGIYWWLPVYLVVAAFGVISWAEAVVIGVGLGVVFPIACDIGRSLRYEAEFDLRIVKLRFSRGWENQELVYGLVQGIALWYVVLS